MYQAFSPSAGDGIAAASGKEFHLPTVRNLLPPLSPILLGLVAAKYHEQEEAHNRLGEILEIWLPK